MRTAFATLALVGIAAAAQSSSSSSIAPGAVASAVAPSASPPPGCSPNYDGSFELGPVNVTTSRKRDTPLGITLKNGVLTDPQGRTGYVASNSQFQFDDPPQAGAIYTAGFTVCQNGSMAIGDTAVWQECLSGSFYNLYLHNNGGQCHPIYLVAVPQGGTGGPAPVTGPLSTAGNSSGTASTTAPASNSTIVPSNSTANATATRSATTTALHGTRPTVPMASATGGGGGGSGGSGGSGSGSGGSGGSSGGSGGSSSSSSGAADLLSSKGEMIGLAAGLLGFMAFAML